MQRHGRGPRVRTRSRSKRGPDIRDLLDRRNIPRRRNGVRRAIPPETPSRTFEEFIPRHERRAPSRPSRDGHLAEMVAELREIADPLGPSDPQKDVRSPDIFSKKPKPKIICASCGGAFEGNRNAKFCGGACRIKHWRAEQ
jgi:hypothetical protein